MVLRTLLALVLLAATLLCVRSLTAPPRAEASAVERLAPERTGAASGAGEAIAEIEARAEERDSRAAIEIVDPSVRPPAAGMARVDVRVVDQAGDPIENAVVSARGSASPYFVGRLDATRMPWTDVRGRAPFDTLPGSTMEVAVITPEGASKIVATIETPAAGETAEIEVAIAVEAFQGDADVLVVSSRTKAPIEGATVWARPEVSLGRNPRPAVTTDVDGAARLPVKLGDRVVVEAPGHSLANVALDWKAGRRSMFVVLNVHARMHGQVTSSGSTSFDDLWDEDAHVSLGRDGFFGREELGTAKIARSGTWSIDGISIPHATMRLDGLQLDVVVGRWSRRARSNLSLRPADDLRVDYELDTTPGSSPFGYGRGWTREVARPSGANPADR